MGPHSKPLVEQLAFDMPRLGPVRQVGYAPEDRPQAIRAQFTAPKLGSGILAGDRKRPSGDVGVLRGNVERFKINE